jgi:DNA polymerase III subunit chi
MPMTQVDFHFNAPDKLPYVCRLLRKASGQGRKVGVLADQDTSHFLNQLLWNLNGSDFVTHCLMADSPTMVENSSVILGSIWEDLTALQQLDVFLNLNHSAPPNLEGIERLIEVVGPEESDKSSARQRWKHYSQLGFQINRFDLTLAKPN